MPTRKKTQATPGKESGERDITPLNFRVPTDFHREFKAYAAIRGKSMVDVLQEAFELLKKHGK